MATSPGINSASYSPSEIVLPLIVLIVIVLFLAWMLYLLLSSNFQESQPGKRVPTDQRSDTQFLCGPGQCATNLLSGFKTCPETDQSITINPQIEVCNSRYTCENPLTPFALQSDGSTNFYGACEQNVICPCLRYLQCPSYVLSAFTVSNGNAFSSLTGQRILFPQTTTYGDDNGNPNDLPPLRYNDLTTFCSAPLSWLPLSNPGCNFIPSQQVNEITYQELLVCVGQQKGCNGIQGSPCLQGTLALLTADPNKVTQKDIQTAQFACVQGEPCDCGQLALFDTSFGSITCRSLPPG